MKFSAIFQCFVNWYTHIFQKSGKWWNYLLYLLVILLFFAIRVDANLWLQKTIGKYLYSCASYLSVNGFLRWLIVAAIITSVLYFFVKKIKDFYRSVSKTLFLLAIIIILWTSSEYWDYVQIVYCFTFLHLIIFSLIAIIGSGLFVPRMPAKFLVDDAKPRFTVDNIKKTSITSDKNRQAYARYLVEMILNTDISHEALSVGVSGEWGSGKSTFLENIKTAFEEEKSGRISTIVEYHPWDGASSGQIVADFFNLLVDKLGKNYSVLRKPLLKYAELLMAFEFKKPVVFLAGLLDRRKNQSLGATKELISEYLRRYGKIIPVLIDDLDRLTADEIADVLKLIRNTADFPNVVYVAAYDKEYVCEQLEHRRKIGRASDYLEKFFNVEFVLPKLDDRYQYEVLLEEVKAMNPPKELLGFVEALPNGIRQLLYKHFGNFRQVKRFARILVHDFYYCLKKPYSNRIIELEDLFLLKMLAFLDLDTYMKLEKKPSLLVISSRKMWCGFRPLELRPGLLGETVKEKDKEISYAGVPLPEASIDILRRLFAQPLIGRKKSCFINPESAPIYFMLNIPSRTIPYFEVIHVIDGEDDIEKSFEKWKDEEKLSSLYNHLIGINQMKMTEQQAKRYIYISLLSILYLNSSNYIAYHVFSTYHYDAGLYDALNKYVKELLGKLIEMVGEKNAVGFNRLMKCFTNMYHEQAYADSKNEETPATILGTTNEIVELAEKTFFAYTEIKAPDADDVFRDSSWTRSIIEDAVVSFRDDEGELLGCFSLIVNAMLSYFNNHKGKNKEKAVHYFDIAPDTPIEIEPDVAEDKYYDKLRIFGSEENYNKFVAECFD